MELVGRKLVEDEEGQKSFEDLVISPFPIYLSSMLRNEKTGEITFEFHKKEPHRDWHPVQVPAADMYKTTWPATLASYGCLIRADGQKSFRSYIEAAMEKLKNDTDEGIQYEQYGWKLDRSAFLLGNDIYEKGGTIRRAPGAREAGNRAFMFNPPSGASLEVWTAAANKLFAPGMEAQGMVMLASLGSPLMTFLTHGLEGGAIIHLYSPHGGKGKTTALTGAASVWGRQQGLQIKENDTFVGRERMLVSAGNLPIFNEELAMDNELNAEKFVRMYTTGRGRTRGTKTGTLDMPSEGWENIMISAANVSLNNLLMRRGTAEPMSTRVLEVTVSVPPGKVLDLARTLDNALDTNRALAGRAFIKFLLQPGAMEKVQAMMDKTLQEYSKFLSVEKGDRFYARLLTCCTVAGVIANHIGLLSFDMARMKEYMLERIVERHKATVARTPVDTLVAYFSEYVDCCLVVDKTAAGQIYVVKDPRNHMYMRYEKYKNRILMLPQPFRDFCHQNGYAYLDVARELEADNILRNRARQYNITQDTSYAPVKGTCWEIDVSHPMLGEKDVSEVKTAPAQVVPLRK